MRRVNGWAFPDDDVFMANEMKPGGLYQADHLARALAHVTDWSLAVDAGAHIGTWTRLLSQQFEKVIAVEPSPDTFEALTENMRRFQCTNTDLRHVALGNRPGFVRMAIDPDALAKRNTGARYVREGGDIPMATIDDWHLPSLGFLKLDVEGSEVAILEGAALTIARCRPIVLFENKGFWRRYGLRADAPHVLLRDLGYQHLEKVGADEIWNAVAHP